MRLFFFNYFLVLSLASSLMATPFPYRNLGMDLDSSALLLRSKNVILLPAPCFFQSSLPTNKPSITYRYMTPARKADYKMNTLHGTPPSNLSAPRLATHPDRIYKYEKKKS